LNEHPDGGWILVVEDDADVRGEVRVALEDHGYAVLEAEDGREALRVLFGESRPDVRLIISDLVMPRMSGSEMLQILSSYSRSSRIPVVVVSGTKPPVHPKSYESVMKASRNGW
jgi:CheY-like chemotaxis protein